MQQPFTLTWHINPLKYHTAKDAICRIVSKHAHQTKVKHYHRNKNLFADI